MCVIHNGVFLYAKSELKLQHLLFRPQQIQMIGKSTNISYVQRNSVRLDLRDSGCLRCMSGVS